MKLLAVLVVCIGAIAVSWAQAPAPLLPANGESNAPPPSQATGTNQPEVALLQQRSEKVESLEARAVPQDHLESERLKTELIDAKTRLDTLGDRLNASNDTLHIIFYSVVALATVSILGLLAFCFYTLRRLTQLGEPIFDNLHQRHPAFPYGVPVGALPQQTGQVESSPGTAVATLGENRLLNAVDRLERKIEEIERTAHPETNHAPLPSADVSQPDLSLNHRHADRFVLLLSKGEAHTNLQQFDKAIECFERAISLAPTDPSPLVKKGHALEKLGRLDDAVDCFNQALQLDPSCSMAYLFKGGVCNRLQKYAEAIECYDRALAVGGNENSGH